MSTNRHALIRYRTIDQCLRDRENTYRLKDLIEACSQAISNYAGEPAEVKRRTLLYDLKFMKDDVAGFSAPIENDRTEGYFYSDPRFSIFFNPLKQTDLDTLKSTLLDLQRISGKKGFEDLESVITRLEATYNIKRSRNEKPTVQFEHSTNIEGQKHVSTIKKYIADQQPLQIRYEPFDEPQYTRYISPYLLKEYNNRWFLIGYEYDSDWGVTVLALDRIKRLGKSVREFYTHPEYDPDTFHNDIIGVTLPSDGKRVTVELKAFGKARHYINTKPLHHSQVLVKMGKKSARFAIEVIPNPELETKLLAFGEHVEVVSPKSLRKRIAQRLSNTSDLYQVRPKKKKPKKKKK